MGVSLSIWCILSHCQDVIGHCSWRCFVRHASPLYLNTYLPIYVLSVSLCMFLFCVCLTSFGMYHILLLLFGIRSYFICLSVLYGFVSVFLVFEYLCRQSVWWTIFGPSQHPDLLKKKRRKRKTKKTNLHQPEHLLEIFLVSILESIQKVEFS